jgi:hypothetical protein
MPGRFDSFDDFWVFYVQQHKNSASRTLHVTGTTLAMGLLAYGLLRRRALPLVLAPIAGYGLAWAGHVLFEKNLPTSFSHPIWGLRAGFRMWAKTVTGGMQVELDRCLTERSADVSAG